MPTPSPIATHIATPHCQGINHGEHDVNRARAMTQDPSIIATRSDCAEVFVFRAPSLDGEDSEGPASSSGQRQASPASPASSAAFDPLLALRQHTQGGFGLAWNPQHRGQLLSGGDDGLCCVWDLQGSSPPVVLGVRPLPSLPGCMVSSSLYRL